MLEKELFNKYFEKVKDKTWIDLFYKIFNEYQVNTKLRICHFLAQAFHETNHLNVLEENLNYSATGLLKIFSKYFNEETAILYQRNPEKIANKVYANRMGNGDENSGDGFKFKGRGIFQLTGKENYQKFKCLENPQKLITDKDFTIRIACDYWLSKKLNEIADKNDIIEVSRKINGGKIGLEERKEIFKELFNKI